LATATSACCSASSFLLAAQDLRETLVDRNRPCKIVASTQLKRAAVQHLGAIKIPEGGFHTRQILDGPFSILLSSRYTPYA
jgi:hypothetical protein